MGIKDTAMVLDGAMEHRLNRVISAHSTFCRGFFQEEHEFQSCKQVEALPQPQRLQFLEPGGVGEISRTDSFAVAPDFAVTPGAEESLRRLDLFFAHKRLPGQADAQRTVHRTIAWGQITDNRGPGMSFPVSGH